MAQEDDAVPKSEVSTIYPGRPYSPYADRAFPTMVLFGDTHSHTNVSADAAGGGTRLGPRDAYRFARGDQVISNTGQPAKLQTPLDFYVVTDHTDGMGTITDILSGAPNIMADPVGKEFHDKFSKGGQEAANAAFQLTSMFAQGKMPAALNYQPGNPAYAAVWDDLVKAADEFNDPGKFTTLFGYRMDVARQGQQPAPRRDLSRRCRQGRARCCPIPPHRRRAAPTRATCGNGCRTTRTRPAARCWPFRTTATCPTA